MVHLILKITFRFLPLIVVLAGLLIFLTGAYWFLIKRRKEISPERRFVYQLMMLGLVLVSLVVVVLALPVDEKSRERLIGLIGLVASGLVAFSSTTALSNLMAGILLQLTRPFRIGDFIRVGEHFGRVAEQGLFDTEIQSENRELIALPNSHLINNPVTTIRTSGTIISTTLSLGYDVHHAQIEPLLIEAAEESGLGKPFVQVLELGNFAVTYRIAGVLDEVKWLITARSNLCRSVLDKLHGHGIEIMSPTYMNQRRLEAEQTIIPPTVETLPEQQSEDQSSENAEEIVFDKAEIAEKLEQEKQQIKKELEQLAEQLKEAEGQQKETLAQQIDSRKERLEEINNTPVPEQES